VFVALLLARTLTRPVRQLHEATTRVGAGDLSIGLPEDRADEFGDLQRAFNRMVAELRETQDLRVRVEKAAAWREMARQIAHEIKNPLTPIKLTVQNLLAAHREDPDTFNEEFERGARIILDQIEALHRIAGEFSAYARFPTRAPTEVDLNELLGEVTALYAASGGCTVTAEPAPAPLVVVGDRDELRRVLINLVANATQARSTRVTVRAADEGERACLEVVDDGVGIPEGFGERIFEPAFTTKSAGTGLGLPIVKRVIDDHGGTIEIESTPAKGTRIVLRLPKRATSSR